MENTANGGKTAGLLGVLVPIFCCFFVMGFVDMVGIGSNYVKQDLNLTDSQANIFPSLVFFWFLIFAVPISLLMNRIGRKNTVLLSLLITLLSLVIPIFSGSFMAMLIAFSLLGIGNAFMQTSLNPLVSNVINPAKLASTLTFGQFIKAIASFIAPFIAMWGATALIPNFGLGWRAIFPIFAIICALSALFLLRTRISEEKMDKVSGLGECLKLLTDGFVLLSFCGIMCHVGIDVGTNVTSPRILMERLGFTLEDAGFATSLYFIFRTIGCFCGAGFLQRISAKKFFLASVIILAAGLVGLLFASSQLVIYTCIAMIGLGNSNVFSIIFAQALIRRPDEGNEVSGLMIMGLFGGTLFPLAMGWASDAVSSQAGALIVMIVGGFYLLFYTFCIRSENV